MTVLNDIESNHILYQLSRVGNLCKKGWYCRHFSGKEKNRDSIRRSRRVRDLQFIRFKDGIKKIDIREGFTIVILSLRI